MGQHLFPFIFCEIPEKHFRIMEPKKFKKKPAIPQKVCPHHKK